MSERERNQRKALEYARSQGWLPPEEYGAPIKIPALTEDQLIALRATHPMRSVIMPAPESERIADLESAVDLQKTTIADLEEELRKLRGRGMRKRAAELEAVLHEIVAAHKRSVGDDLDTAIDRARELLG